MSKVDFLSIEKKWQEIWEQQHVYEADVDKKRKKFFATFPFPYMSGPVHVGTAYTLTRLDVICRFKRHLGYNVLLPFAWHWTGVTIAGVSERIKRRDPETIRILRDLDKVPEETILKFEDPIFMAKYYTEKNREAIKSLGVGIDWRREFHTTSDDRCYSKFVEWQYLKLREGGYIKRGEHPVVWCPRCKSVTGDHDRLVGEGVFPATFTLVKYRMRNEENKYIVAATFRPETVFGVTNIWINPNSKYVEAKVDGENWIISEKCAEKLKDQKKNVTILSEFNGEKLIGKVVVAPIVNREVPILPAYFVDPELATGVVYSVPAHAPYDYMALIDLKKNENEIKKFGIDVEMVRKIEPISIIKTERFGTNPSEKIVNEMKIYNQLDPKLEEATSIVYKEEFLHGYLLGNTGEFKDIPVKEAKVKVAELLKREKLGDEMLDLPSPVICRCGTRTHVKILTDQYLLKYSDKSWKEKAKACLSRMKIFPEEARVNFEWFIDWYDDWAFVRTFGLGTKLPWDEKYLIETLSDSTVYMAYYIISKFVNEGKVTYENLKPEFFDYVMLGRGNPEDVAKNVGLSKEFLESIKKEFDYWYPVDLRISGKDLIANHLTFYIFHHVAIFPEEKWPRGIAVNGFMRIRGQPMHKSKGIFISIREAVEKYGADVVRLSCVTSADGLEDPDWRDENINSISQLLNNIYEMVVAISEEKVTDEESKIDLWLSSKIVEHIKNATDYLNAIEIRKAAIEIFFNIRNTIKRYMRRRKDNLLTPTLRKAINAWIIMMSPFTPHISEELWKIMKNNSLVVKEPWPRKEDFISNEIVLFEEDYIDSLIEDVQNVRKVLKTKPSRILIFVASKSKKELTKIIAMNYLKGKKEKEIIQDIMATFRGKLTEEELKRIHTTVNKCIEKIRTLSGEKFLQLLNTINEEEVLNQAKDYIAKELDLREVNIVNEESEEAKSYPKARTSEPFRPSFILE